MNRMAKQLMAWTLTLALLFTSLPLFELPVEAEDGISGKCGDNLTWSFDEATETLTIEGNGAMDCDPRDGTPWYDYNEQIKTVKIGNGVTAICEDAFAWCYNLEEVTIPETVTQIGADAFYDCVKLTEVRLPDGLERLDEGAFLHCYSLTEIRIPDGVTEIGPYAFQDCHALTSVTIPDSVEKIGDSAFSGCTMLRSVTVPAGVTELGEYAFGFCSGMNEILVDGDNPSYCSVDGVLYTKDMTVLLQFPRGKYIDAFTVPDGVKVIGNAAFSNCIFLHSLELPESLEYIGDSAFAGCNVEKMTVPGTVRSIGNGAFTGCYSLRKLKLGEGIEKIDERAFYFCSSLKYVSIPASVTEIGPFAFGYDSEDNIEVKVEAFEISGFENSEAQTYAAENGFPFTVLTGDEPDEPDEPDEHDTPSDPLDSFKDVEKGKWYSDAVAWAIVTGITKGTSDTTFSPDAPCTRAQVVTFLWRAAGCPEPASGDNPFADVKADAYYSKAVLWALEQRITTGTDATHFSPDAPCTRGQIVTFLARANLQNKGGEWDNPFTDVDESAYYFHALGWAYLSGITKGTTPTSFSPDATCTRAQVVTFLYRVNNRSAQMNR